MTRRWQKWGLTGLIMLLSLTLAPTKKNAQEKRFGGRYGYITESMARQRATASVLPDYPEKAIEQAVTGIVVAKIEINTDGYIIRARIKPGTNPLVKKSLADALEQWKFSSFSELSWAPGRTILSRLTFNYLLEDGKGRVEMYIPPQDVKTTERLDYMSSNTEWNEWREWEDTYVRKYPNPELNTIKKN